MCLCPPFISKLFSLLHSSCTGVLRRHGSRDFAFLYGHQSSCKNQTFASFRCSKAMLSEAFLNFLDMVSQSFHLQNTQETSGLHLTPPFPFSTWDGVNNTSQDSYCYTMKGPWEYELAQWGLDLLSSVSFATLNHPSFSNSNFGCTVGWIKKSMCSRCSMTDLGWKGQPQSLDRFSGAMLMDSHSV